MGEAEHLDSACSHSGDAKLASLHLHLVSHLPHPTDTAKDEAGNGVGFVLR